MTSKEQIEREQALLDMRPGEPQVWRDGGFVIEKDLAASGNAPVVPSLAPVDTIWTPMPVNDFYSAIIDNANVGVLERVKDGRHEAMAWALCGDGERLESPIYGLVPQADYRSVDPLDSQKPIRVYDMTQAAANERIAAATYARATMRENERSPIDMIQVAKELAATTLHMQREWQSEQDRAAEQAKADAEAIALYRQWERGRALVEGKKKHD